MKKKTLVIIGAVLAAILLAIVLLSQCFVLTVRYPVNGAVKTYPGRATLYLHSSENYTGKAIFVLSDPTDPYWCSGDNGTHVLTGFYGSLKIYDINGSLLYGEPLHPAGDWILKSSSGVLVWDWEFGGSKW